MFRLLPHYRGPRPTGDDFIPYDGDLNQAGRPARRAAGRTRSAWGCCCTASICFGLGGMTTAAHTEEDVERTVAAVAGTLELLEGERPA